MIAVAKSTCFIGVSCKDNSPISGTSFFVSPTLLLTAGHIASDKKQRIVAQTPGTQHAELYVEVLFDKPDVDTFECEMVETGWPHIDVSVLRVKGEYKSRHWVEIGQQALRVGDPVDIIGYPGLYSERNVLIMQTPAIRPDRDANRAVFDLFPKCELIASYGLIDFECDLPTYQLSSVVGMSGSPVLSGDKVVGKTSLLTLTFIFWGSHRQGSTDSRKVEESVCCVFLEKSG